MSKIKQLEHDVTSMTESTQALFNEVAELSEPLKLVQKYKKQFVKMFDKNKDGKVTANEALSNPLFFKWILIVLLAVGVSVLASVFTTFIFEGVWDFSVAGTVIQFLVAPFLMGIMQKGTMDDYDGRLKGKEESIVVLKENLVQEKRDRDQDNKRSQLFLEKTKLDHSNELHTMEMALGLKTQYIELYCKEKLK